MNIEHIFWLNSKNNLSHHGLGRIDSIVYTSKYIRAFSLQEIIGRWLLGWYSSCLTRRSFEDLKLCLCASAAHLHDSGDITTSIALNGTMHMYTAVGDGEWGTSEYVDACRHVVRGCVSVRG